MPRTTSCAPSAECAFGTCKFACIRSSYRKNFIRAYPDGFPVRGSNVYRCRECGHACSQSEMEVDHMKPQSSGGTNCVKNLQPLCGRTTANKCNQKKGAEYDFGDKIANKVSPTVRRKTGRILDMFKALKV